MLILIRKRNREQHENYYDVTNAAISEWYQRPWKLSLVGNDSYLHKRENYSNRLLPKQWEEEKNLGGSH